MASVVVDGLVVPVAVAGHPALDFCNTRAGWGAPRPKEYLHTHAHLAVWAREQALLSPAATRASRRAATAEPDAAEAIVDRALALRSALYAVVLGRATPPDWAVVNAEVQAAARAAALEPAAAAALPARWVPAETGVAAPLTAVAWSAAHLLTAPDAAHIGACPGDGCGWVFLDPRRRRRWCSMAWCGNRNKARRHAQRRRPTPQT